MKGLPCPVLKIRINALVVPFNKDAFDGTDLTADPNSQVPYLLVRLQDGQQKAGLLQLNYQHRNETHARAFFVDYDNLVKNWVMCTPRPLSGDGLMSYVGRTLDWCAWDQVGTAGNYRLAVFRRCLVVGYANEQLWIDTPQMKSFTAKQIAAQSDYMETATYGNRFFTQDGYPVGKYSFPDGLTRIEYFDNRSSSDSDTDTDKEPVDKARYAHLVGQAIRPVADAGADWLLVTACTDEGLILITDAVIPWKEVSKWSTVKGPIHG